MVKLRKSKTHGKKQFSIPFNFFFKKVNGVYAMSDQSTNLLSSNPLSSGVPNLEMFQGIQSIIKSSSVTSKKTELEAIFPVYTSGSRQLGLQICGWGGLTRKEVLEQAISKLEAEGETERAAALAVFHLNLRRATTILSSAKSGDKSSLKLVAMALAGCSEQTGTKGSLSFVKF